MNSLLVRALGALSPRAMAVVRRNVTLSGRAREKGRNSGLRLGGICHL